jgi:hypothetical protein
MLEKIGRVAERTATNVSRRQFLGRLGRAAMAVVAMAGGLLAQGSEAQASVNLCSKSQSAPSCQNRIQGSPCRIGPYMGRCVNAPSCYCQVAGPPRR